MMWCRWWWGTHPRCIVWLYSIWGLVSETKDLHLVLSILAFLEPLILKKGLKWASTHSKPLELPSAWLMTMRRMQGIARHHQIISWMHHLSSDILRISSKLLGLFPSWALQVDMDQGPIMGCFTRKNKPKSAVDSSSWQALPDLFAWLAIHWPWSNEPNGFIFGSTWWYQTSSLRDIPTIN